MNSDPRFAAMAGDATQAVIELDAKVLVSFVQYVPSAVFFKCTFSFLVNRCQQALDRSVTESRRSMVKSGTGLSVTSGMLHTLDIPTDTIKSQNPRPATVARLSEQQTLRFELKRDRASTYYSFVVVHTS